jgi:acylphosphatase
LESGQLPQNYNTFITKRDIIMAAAVKSIFATVTNHIQMVGYREIVETNGKIRGLNGLVFNDPDGSVKIMVSGPESAVSEFIHDLEIVRPDTKIETKELADDLNLPYPFGRVVTDDMREISDRLDKGNSLLSSHDLKLGSIDVKLDKLDGLSKLDNINDSISGINERLDSLPERIAEAMKR